MENISLEALLKEEEDRLRNQLRADDAVDQDRMQSVSRLQDAFRHALLRYNAASSGDGTRQAVADSVTAPVLDMAELLLSGTAKREISKRPLRAGAVVALLLAAVCCLAAALIVSRSYQAGCILMAVSAVSAYFSGRLWYGEREVKVRAGIDAELTWKTADRTAFTLDRKIDDLCLQIRQWEEETRREHAASGSDAIDPEQIRLMSDLLEALYSENGSYALQQLKKIRPYLRAKGIDVQDYTPEAAEAFELLPTKLTPATLRPALRQGEKLLLPGRATEAVDSRQANGRKQL